MRDSGAVNQSLAVLLIWTMYLVLYMLIAGRVQLSKRNLYLTIGGLTYPLYLIHSKAGTTIIDH